MTKRGTITGGCVAALVVLLAAFLGGGWYYDSHCHHITGVKQVGDELRFRVDEQSVWISEAELPAGIDPAELGLLKQTIASARAQHEKAERQKREAWIHETTEQAISSVRKDLPTGFDVHPLGLYVVASDCEKAQLKELDALFQMIQQRCREIRGVARQIPVGPIRVYYAKSEFGYRAAYEAAMGEKLPLDHLMGGVCSHEHPPRLFGLASVGNGSLSHELVVSFRQACDFFGRPSDTWEAGRATQGTSQSPSA